MQLRSAGGAAATLAPSLTPPHGNGNPDVQKKVSPLGNPRLLAGELFPHWEETSALVVGGGAGGGAEGGGGEGRSGLVVVASLVTKAPNLGGKLDFGTWRNFSN